MERVQTLVNKLQHQLEAGISETDMIVTVQLLYAELLSGKKPIPDLSPGKPYVMAALAIPEVKIPVSLTQQAPVEEIIPENEKIIEVLEVDENQIEAELDQIKKNAAAKNYMGASVRSEVQNEISPEYIKDVAENSASQKDTFQTEPPVSINDRLKGGVTELSDKLVETPIKDLKKAIGVNDRYVFINELFNGDEAMYERSIKTINGFSIYPEAEYWIRRELKLKLGWKESLPAVKEFDQLVRRRFL